MFPPEGYENKCTDARAPIILEAAPFKKKVDIPPAIRKEFL
jgi:hypothetical protein